MVRPLWVFVVHAIGNRSKPALRRKARRQMKRFKVVQALFKGTNDGAALAERCKPSFIEGCAGPQELPNKNTG